MTLPSVLCSSTKAEFVWVCAPPTQHREDMGWEWGFSLPRTSCSGNLCHILCCRVNNGELPTELTPKSGNRAQCADPAGARPLLRKTQELLSNMSPQCPRDVFYMFHSDLANHTLQMKDTCGLFIDSLTLSNHLVKCHLVKWILLVKVYSWRFAFHVY